MTDETDRSDRSLMDAEGLLATLGSPRPPILLDIRWRLGRSDGREDYLAGHIPGAVYVDLDTELAGTPDAAAGGRHPLPAVGVLEAALRRAGIDDDSAVVCYDGGDGLGSARAWWLLRWAGLTEVAVLDGGWSAWLAAGGPVATDVSTPDLGSVTVRPGGMPTLDADSAVELARTGVLLDARTPERFRGEREPIDRVPGRVPGAVNAPAAGDRDPGTGRWETPENLRRRYAELGVSTERPVGAYCGSGVTAAGTVLALWSASIDAALYVGSYSDWVSDPERPVETG